MTITANYPTVKPSLILDFTKGQALDPRISFSRAASSAYYYDGKTSVLAEQNLIFPSQVLTNATYWIPVNSTPTGNSTTAPDGTTTANTITDNATNGQHRVYQGGGNLSSATALTASAYFLQGTGTFGQLGLYDGSAYRTVTANLSTGVITETFGTATSTITALSGGWYRLTLSFTGGSSNATLSVGLSNTGTPNGLASYVGTGSTIYAWGAQLEQRSSATAYNATTTSAITNYIPQLQSAGTNIPRFDYNPATGESLGFLIEQASTNLILYSSNATQTGWASGSVSITATANIAPDGTQTAQRLVEDTSTGVHRVQTALNSYSGTYTASIYAKAYGTNRRLSINTNAILGTGIVYFDLVTGTVASGTGTITAVGNGWYRCSVTGTGTGTSNWVYYEIATTANSDSYTGDGWSGIYIWGAQLEALANSTSYIPTTGAQATRAQDSATIAGTNFSSWYNQGQGTFYVNFSRINTGSATAYPALFTTDTLLEFADGTYEVIKSNPANIQYSASSVTKSERKSIFAYSPSVGIASAIDGGNYLSNSSAPITNKSTTYFTR